MGQTIAVVSGKGGTGKTSFTANVGMALAQMGYRTLCMDCDIGLRNLDLALAMTDRAVMDFTDVLARRCSLAEAATAHPVQKNLYLLTAPSSVSRETLERARFQEMLEDVRRKYDFCLMDASAGLGLGFRVAVADTDRAVVVTTTDQTSLRDAQRTVMELNHLPRGKVHLVVNRCRKKLMKSLHQTLDDAIDTAGLPLLGVIPEDETMALYAGRATPLLLTENDYSARAYRNIARRITGQKIKLMNIR